MGEKQPEVNDMWLCNFIIKLCIAVCIKFLTKFGNSLTGDDKATEEEITAKLRKACGKAKGKENRFVSVPAFPAFLDFETKSKLILTTVSEMSLIPPPF